MLERKSNVKIENGKVIFSKEILDYFENIKTKENSIWIDKYFEVLSDPSNFNSEKFNIHHIRPCCTFKDKEHKNRKQALSLADEFNENRIKLSIYNHMFAHFYAWKIFNIKDLKNAFQRMCGQGKYIDTLTENELKNIARLKEDCAKKNQTEEEKLEYRKNYRENNKEYRKENKDKVLKYHRNYSSQLSYDPIQEEFCTYSALKHRQQRNRELYKDVILAKCIIKHI